MLKLSNLFQNKEKPNGFTLIEAILSLTIIGVIGSLSFPIYQGYQTSHDVSLTTSQLTSSFRRAQALAVASENDSDWGVYYTPGNLVIFSGSSYAVRNSAFDEVMTLPTNVAFTGPSEIVFSKFYGAPNLSATITLQAGSYFNNFVINSKGFIE